MRDDQRRRARSLLSVLEGAVRSLSPGPEASEVRTAVDALTVALDLGPEEHLRACPVCGATGQIAATRCGTCWSKLTPPMGELG
jgi:hypothetical protein